MAILGRTPSAVESDDFSVYLGTADARSAPLRHLRALASIRQALETPLPVETYVALRSSFTPDRD